MHIIFETLVQNHYEIIISFPLALSFCTKQTPRAYFCIMKFLTLLFAGYMLALCCVPCICEDICAKEKTEHSASKEKQQDDNCMPFCSCSCCHSLVTNVKPVLSFKKMPAIPGKKKFALADQDFTSYNCRNIWQPPKLS